MGWNRCLTNEPDCLNCPYPDCIATTHDISRQEAHKRKGMYEVMGKEIARMVGYGASRDFVARKYGIQNARVGVYLKRYRDEYLAAQAETQSGQYQKWTREEVMNDARR